MVRALRPAGRPKTARIPFSRIAICLLVWPALGCPGMRPTPTPMPALTLDDSPSGCAVVFLPGVLDKPKDFDNHGFAATLDDAGLEVHAVAADAHLAYYRKRTVLDRLHRDVVAPLVTEGRRVWLVGISLGGVGSLMYGNEHRDEIAGMVLLAPFLGDDEVLEEIEAAGGLSGWTPPEVLAEDDVGRKLWSWIREWQGLDPDRRPQIYLGYGESDDFAEANGRLGELLPEGRVFRRPGGHDWKAWKALWRDVIDSGLFDGCGEAASP